MKQTQLALMPQERQKAYLLSIIDVWLPLLTKGDITPEEFRACIAAIFD